MTSIEPKKTPPWLVAQPVVAVLAAEAAEAAEALASHSSGMRKPSVWAETEEAGVEKY